MFQRALADVKREEDALATIEIRDGYRQPALEGLGAAVAARGEAAVAAALEVFLTELLDLLGRFIGADLVATIAESGRTDALSDSAEA